MPAHLHGHVRAEPPPRVRHVDGPVQADDVRAGRAEALDQAAAAVRVNGDGRAGVLRLDLAHDALDVGPRPGVPHLRADSVSGLVSTTVSRPSEHAMGSAAVHLATFRALWMPGWCPSAICNVEHAPGSQRT